MGDRDAVDAELAALSRLAEELRQGPQRWTVRSSQAALALMEGRLEDADRLIEDAYALGRDALSFNAAVSEQMQRFMLAHERGRLHEVEDALRGCADGRRAMPRFACALAHLHADVGQTDEARASLAELLEQTAARVDPEWLFSLVLLADPCAAVADAALVGNLRSLLLPHEHMYAQSPVEAAFGSVARALGVLAAAARDFDAAAAHFTVSLDVERRMRARPWLAHAQRDFAAMLIARAEPEDPHLATQLLDEAQATYDSLGMAHWAARCAELRLSAQTGVA
jgi:tetratricopeptide (TPR) repeat protein